MTACTFDEAAVEHTSGGLSKRHASESSRACERRRRRSRKSALAALPMQLQPNVQEESCLGLGCVMADQGSSCEPATSPQYTRTRIPEGPLVDELALAPIDGDVAIQWQTLASGWWQCRNPSERRLCEPGLLECA